MREDRLPHRRAEAARRARLADDVREDVVERAADLEEAREDVGGLLAEGARAPADVEVVGKVASVPVEERHATTRNGLGAEPREEGVLVTLVERVEDEVLVETALIDTERGLGDAHA